MHHDGKSGDFARTGLLYLIESATHSASLEQWIIESDLATLMASGLGALYSQLSRKLVLDFDKDSLPPIVSFSESANPPTPIDAEKTTSPEFKIHLTTFLSYLVFWQDVLEYCSSSDVKQSLLDHFKILFLQQLLYVDRPICKTTANVNIQLSFPGRVLGQRWWIVSCSSNIPEMHY